MVLSMSRPWKHPKTGVYYFRKAVPKDLRPHFPQSQWEVKKSLKTHDPADAKIKHAQVAAEIEMRWKALRAKPEPLSQRQIIALAGLAYREIMGLGENEPGETVIWDHVLRIHRAARENGKLEQWIGPTVDDLLQRQGIKVDDATRQRLIDEIDKAHVQASERLKAYSEGDYRPDPDADRFPEWRAAGTGMLSKPVAHSLTGLVEDWWREAKASGTKISTYESYRNTMAKFVAFLGHDDVARVIAEDVIRFKDHRLAQINPKSGKPISAKTVKDSDLSGLRAVFGWAVGNKRMIVNPAAGVTLKIGKRPRLRPKGFTDAEAVALLRASRALVPGRERPKVYAARRWVPWLCAYSGSRVGEMVQLRKEDVRKEGDVWLIRVTPEAFTVKNNEAREVPLHEHLIELGFLQFLEGSKSGYLFLTPKSDGSVRGPWQTIKNRVTEFVRTVVTDPNVQPNHGWRHRFKTIAMEVDMMPRVMDVIQGHAPRTEGERYGDVTAKVMAREMAKLPRYEIEGGVNC